MATAERRQHLVRGLARGPLAALAIAVLAGGAVSAGVGDSGDGGPGAGGGGASEPPTAVSAAVAPGVDDVHDLIAAADLVVRGEVVATSRGRTFGEGGAAIVSRLVTVAVEEVLAGEPPGSPALLVEEEGWLPDGRELAVNGLAPSREGLDAIWFLQDVQGPDLPVWIVVDPRGRYAVRGDALDGPDVDDALVAAVESLGRGGLRDALRGG
ncbi:MAG: hypothetical protein GEV08_09095 [Acidimicrobiia bacterium]|nr:hypothetical protein [Acidimicrobiia bacterium]